MNRTIKFRGKSTIDGKWHHGNFSNINGVNTIDGHTVHPPTVGQYVGLMDLNDNHIYEGDIFISSNKYHTVMQGEIIFEEGAFKMTYGYQTPKGGDRDDYFLTSTIEGESIEVIGNLHDNPEMRK